LEFDFRLVPAVPDALEVIVNRDAQDLLGPLLAYHIGIEVGVDLPGHYGSLGFVYGRGLGTLVFSQLAQDVNAIIANCRPSTTGQYQVGPYLGFLAK
jgi:hypothetical protein